MEIISGSKEEYYIDFGVIRVKPRPRNELPKSQNEEKEKVKNLKIHPDERLLIQVYSTWMVFGGNTLDLGSFGKETDKTTTLHQILEEVVHIECGDGVACFKRRPQEV
ncbi:hypothetical protein Tco_1080783 [Tanacetum coccineum]|uniref:Uncharacterized protein n=1 Tax=Tanacetum coccineum TaxID=301880 RepID=A0ABQ5HVS9_9ASTR